MTDEKIRDLARDQYGCDDLQIDDDAPVSRIEDGVCWVTAVIKLVIPDDQSCEACGSLATLLGVRSNLTDTVHIGKSVCWNCLDVALFSACNSVSDSITDLYMAVAASMTALDASQISERRAHDLAAVASRTFIEKRKAKA